LTGVVTVATLDDESFRRHREQLRDQFLDSHAIEQIVDAALDWQ
jgi:hypothetical protein